MALNTYSGLVTSIANWLERSDLNAQIPDFIALAESKIARKLRVRSMEGRSTAIDLIAGEEYYTLPCDFLEARSLRININPVRVLVYRTPQQINQEYSINDRGTPKYFTIIGNEIQIRPIPSADNELEMAYYSRFTPLSTTVQTNWITNNSPDLILYGALVEASIFLVGDNRATGFKVLFEQSIQEWNDTDSKGRHSGSALEQRTTSGNP